MKRSGVICNKLTIQRSTGRSVDAVTKILEFAGFSARDQTDEQIVRRRARTLRKPYLSDGKSCVDAIPDAVFAAPVDAQWVWRVLRLFWRLASLAVWNRCA